MQATISLNADLLKKAKQALKLTHFKNVEDLIAFLIEERLRELIRQKNDPIYQVRGMLKGKKGGTSLFIQDKQTEIEKE
jgi:hypothetical protein